MSERQPFDVPPLGFFELDGAWTVLYYKPDRGGSAHVEQVVGLNFFKDIAAISRCGDLQEKIEGFRHGPRPAHHFTHTFEHDHGSLEVKVLLARIHEKTPGGGDSVFVHIKQA